MCLIEDEDEGPEAQERLEALRRVKRLKPNPVSTALFKDLVHAHLHEEAQLRKRTGRLRRWWMKFTPEVEDYDYFVCDKAAYELFNRAVEDGLPLGRWVQRMLDVGFLVTDVNYLAQPGWREWPYDVHFCTETGRRYLQLIGIDDEDVQERLIPSMFAYVGTNDCSGLPQSTVFVTGCREFYDEVLLNKVRMERLLDAFLYNMRVLKKPGYLIARVWYVNPDQKVPFNSADEVSISDKLIRCPKGCLTVAYGSPWMRYPGEEHTAERQKKSAFRPDELTLPSCL